MSIVWIVLPLCMILSDTHAQKPTIISSSKDEFAVENTQITLKCITKGNPSPNIVWYRDGRIVETQREKPTTSNKILKFGNLLFLSFKAEDEGVYYCNASNIHDWVASKPITVTTASLSSEQASGPSNQLVYVNEPFQLYCEPPMGVPTPKVAWLHNSKPVQTSSRLQFKNGGLVIAVMHAECSDSGSYICKASNIAGTWKSDAASVTVKYHAPPHSSNTVQVLAGESIEFRCSVPTSGNSTVIWRREMGSVLRAILIDSRTIKLENARITDNGRYICGVNTPDGTLEGSTFVTVLEPPTFTITPEDQTSYVGSSVYLNCYASGVPKPSVRWLKGDSIMWVPEVDKSIVYSQRFRVFHNGTLQIENSSASDSGYYECKASQQGGIVKASAKVSVINRERILIPIVQHAPHNQSILVGRGASFSCRFALIDSGTRELFLYEHLSSHSSPMKYFARWYINGKDARGSDMPRISLVENTLKIDGVTFEDAGEYTCEIESVLNSNSRIQNVLASWTVSLDVINAPTPNKFPTEILTTPLISVRAVGDTWIIVNVSQSNSTVSNYVHPENVMIILELFDFRYSIWKKTVSKQSSGIRVDGLNPDTEYLLTARFSSAMSVSELFVLKNLIHTKASTMLKVRGEQFIDENLVKFKDLNLTALSPSELHAQWVFEGPMAHIASLDGVSATIHASPYKDCIDIRTEPNSGLSNDQASGCSGNAHAISHGGATMFTACSLSAKITESDSTWDPPTFLDSTQISYQPPRLKNDVWSGRMVFSNLQSFMCYKVHIQAFIEHPSSGRMLSRSSPPATSVTFDAPPSGSPKPRKVEWSEEDMSLRLTWSTPPIWERGGVLAGYSIRIFSVPSKPSRYLYVESNQNFIRISDLDEAHNYTIYLAAINCRGEGVRSLPIHVYSYPKLVQPEPPTDSRQNPGRAPPALRFQRMVIYEGQETSSSNSMFMNSNTTTYLLNAGPPDSRAGEIMRQPWVIISIILFSLLWVFVCFGLILCSRYRNRQYRRNRRGGGAFGTLANTDLVTKNGRIICAPSSNNNNNHNNDTYPLALTGSPSTGAYTLNHNGMDPGLMAAAVAANSRQPAFPDSVGATDQLFLNNTNNRIYPTLMTQKSAGSGHTASPNLSNGQSNPVPAYPSQYALMPVQSSTGVGMDGMMHPPHYSMSYGIPVSDAALLAPLCNSSLSDPHGHLLQSSSPYVDPSDDSVTPYASVSVIHTNHPQLDPRQQQQQLSLAEMIPPPPDYPPPNVPSGDDDEEHEELLWSNGGGLAAPPPDHDTAVYYAQSDVSHGSVPRQAGGHVREWSQSQSPPHQFNNTGGSGGSPGAFLTRSSGGSTGRFAESGDVVVIR